MKPVEYITIHIHFNYVGWDFPNFKTFYIHCLN